MKNVMIWLRTVIQETAAITFDLFKLMIPIIILVKLVDLAGGTEVIADLIAPLMVSLGLPPEMGIVWAGAMLSNIYTGMVLFVSGPVSATMSSMQITTLGILMLFAHSLPVELRVASKIGVHAWFGFFFRVLSAYCAAFLYFKLSYLFGMSTHINTQLWQPDIHQQDIYSWLISQGTLLLQIVLIIFILVVFLRFIRALKIDMIFHFILRPILPFLGLSEKAVNTVLVGMTLGMTYGGGLLIQESRRGILSTKELLFSVCLLLILHGLIEDTLLILLLGADIHGILTFRLFFSLMLIAILVRLFRDRPEAFYRRWLMNSQHRPSSK